MESKAANTVCLKCGGAMEQGFVMDKTRVAHEVLQWFAGPPEKSFWMGTKTPNESLPVGAFRCSQCGYLEFFASADFAAK